MHELLLGLHSILRYVLLVLLVVATLRSFAAWIMGGHYFRSDDRMALFTVIFTHLQLLIGLILYFFTSQWVRFEGMGEVMNDPKLRFFTLEHIALGLIAIILITIGRSRSKRAYSEIAKHKRIAIFFGIALILIFLAIPWPFMKEFQQDWITLPF